MIDKNLIRDILAQYKKHGWILSRVLLLPETEKNLGIAPDLLFGDVEVCRSNVDAVWFTRASTKNRVAWELRHLSENPFALFETFDQEIEKEVLMRSLTEMETRLIEKSSNSGG